MVVFSSGFGYLLASNGSIGMLQFCIVSLIGGFLISGASVTINQILEKEIRFGDETHPRIDQFLRIESLQNEAFWFSVLYRNNLAS